MLGCSQHHHFPFLLVPFWFLAFLPTCLSSWVFDFLHVCFLACLCPSCLHAFLLACLFSFLFHVGFLPFLSAHLLACLFLYEFFLLAVFCLLTEFLVCLLAFLLLSLARNVMENKLCSQEHLVASLPNYINIVSILL